jgi:NADH-quinone oxidoreductase subunit G/NADP-reducing hydrogenase subunit HndD
MKITVNDRQIEAKEGETILSALERENIRVPTLCHLKELNPTGACRVCVVELEDSNRLVPSCSFPVSEGMKIQTHSLKAIEARKTILELLLANHPDDCLYCIRNGNCDLSNLSKEYDVRNRTYPSAVKKKKSIDISSPSIVRDKDKCILCGKCVRVCEEIQGVSAIDFINRGSKVNVGCAFDQNLNVSNCVKCGQCILVCPTAALSEKTHINKVLEALNDKDKIVVVQHAPSISVSIAEEFGMKPGLDVCGLLNTALRKAGFKRIFDTSFSADLTIMEEASELVDRVKNNGKLPMMTSCSPGWVKFVETFYPEFIDNISSCKSPQQMLGAIIKSHFAEKEGIDRSKIFSVSLMPCTAKKFEAERPEMIHDGVADIDAVLTTRELAQLLKILGINLNSLEPSSPDLPFGNRSTAGKLFGATGGVMEAAIRTAYYLLTDNDMEDVKIQSLRGFDEIKETKVNINGIELGFAVVSGLKNAHKILKEIKEGRKDIHFIEVMTCPGGCINGGGQPIGSDKEALKQRMMKLYNIDQEELIRFSHRNPAILDLYKEYLKEPLGEKSHHLLHTSYNKRELV